MPSDGVDAGEDGSVAVAVDFDGDCSVEPEVLPGVGTAEDDLLAVTLGDSLGVVPADVPTDVLGDVLGDVEPVDGTPPLAEGLGETVGACVGAADGLALPVLGGVLVGFCVGSDVGVLVGDAVAVDDGTGPPKAGGARVGGPWLAPCHAKATEPPSGTVNELTPRVE